LLPEAWWSQAFAVDGGLFNFYDIEFDFIGK
jgi:hypothetical protein